MITNQRQYHRTKTLVRKFQTAIDEYEPNSSIDPVIAKAERDGLQSQLGDLKRELRRYENLRSGIIAELKADSIIEIGTRLIEARIASRLTQRELADRLGMKEQQIQRYEMQGYQQASLARLAEISAALNLSTTVSLEVPSQ